MPIPLPKYSTPYRQLVRDVRPIGQRIAEYWDRPNMMGMTALSLCAVFIFYWREIGAFADVVAALGALYFRWGFRRTFHLPFKMPKFANIPDPRNSPPGGSGAGKSEGILYIGNTTDRDNPDFGQEIWFTNNDARTHLLYLGTTGAGKTEGLKALVTNALAWGSGYVYVDGKADTDLWASLYSVARRFGRDDDLLVLNYMTGNSDDGALSNTMNPFSNGSSSYLSNMITSFMPDAGGDNAMWKERAVALMFALMPALTYKRDHQGLLLDIAVVREHIELQPIIKLGRDPTLPERIANGLQGYLKTLPGFVDAAFDDEGNEKPPSPDQPMYDLQIARQQHGYLSMQFTRSLQMLSDEYGYIFKAQLADVDVLDVVLNRRIMVTLIPALEKSGDEAANLGKIVAASLKGMMGATLGNAVEGTWETAIGSKQTRSGSSFMTVFDEVGYYTAQGMAVMAAQARSLGFSLVFASQDLPSMEKRVKQEAKSIVGNCNIKIFGRLEDPTDTKDFLEKHGGTFWALETTGMSAKTDGFFGSMMNAPFYDKMDAGSVQSRQRVAYDHIRDQREGEIHLFYGDWVAKAKMFYVSPEKVKALRVHRLLPVPGVNDFTTKRERSMKELLSRLQDADWTAAEAGPAVETNKEIAALAKGLSLGKEPLEGSVLAIGALNAVAATKGATRQASEDVEPDEMAPPPKPPRGAPAAIPNGNGQAATTNGNGQAVQGSVAISHDTMVKIPSISPTERISSQTNLPPLYEGDQFAIIDVENMPVPASGPLAGFGGSDADFSVVTPVGGEDGDISVMDVELPHDITAILEQSAQKLNKGLGGEGKKSE